MLLTTVLQIILPTSNNNVSSQYVCQPKDAVIKYAADCGIVQHLQMMTVSGIQPLR